MLLAVEGGFISSSASGYSKGLAFLLFGIGGERDERSMRVSPWSHHYQLVHKDIKPEPSLAPRKNGARTHRGCASFLCFRRPSTGIDGASPLKVEPVAQQDGPSVSPSGGNSGEVPNGIGGPQGVKVFLKSSLKKPLEDGDGGASKEEREVENESSVVGTAVKRKVQWTDGCGRELTEIREFEPSEAGESGDEGDDENGRSCSCIIQ
ncbi:uncharacterized protein LOC116256364 [Nymphaea colorata]|nr:uncharacterized protein LOC116256364 [Nymphaea colorata]